MFSFIYKPKICYSWQYSAEGRHTQLGLRFSLEYLDFAAFPPR